MPSQFSIRRIYATAVVLFKKDPLLFLPFFLGIVVDLLIVGFVLLIPQTPLGHYLGGAISRFWGVQFLHYPGCLFLVPKVYLYAHYIVGMTVGILLSGLAIFLVHQAYMGERLDLEAGLKRAVRRFPRLFVLWIITFVAIIMSGKLLHMVSTYVDMPLMVFAVKFAVTVGMQALVVCSIPAVILENKKILSSLVRAVAMARHYPVQLIVFVLVPSLLFLPLLYLNAHMPMLIDYTPKVVVYAVIVRILTNGVVDMALTAASTVLLITHRQTYDVTTGTLP